MKKITIKDLFDKSGAVLVRCDKEWGGTHAYKNSPESNLTIAGFKTEKAAVDDWFKDHFGVNKDMLKMIKYLITRANSQLMAAIDDKAQFASKLAEAQKDQVRLEWMMNNSAYVAYSMDGEVCHVRITADRGEDEYPVEGYPLKVYDDRRQAIDAAIAQQKVKT